MRAREFYPKTIIFSNEISPNDIEQGALGTCYFLAALSAFAEDPERVRTRFITQEVNAAGIYLVTFFINGILSPVIVDDYWPIKYGKPCFSHSKD